VKWGIVFTIVVVFGIGTGLLISVSAEEELIPFWIKTTTGYWVDGIVGDSEFISALQFLINHGVIEIPITEVSAANVNLEDKDRAMSFVVNFSRGNLDKPFTIYTFYTFFHLSSSIDSKELDLTKGLEKTPAFILQSLPSKDKQLLYDLVNKYIDATSTLGPFDVTVEVLAGDSEIIQTWEYRRCGINDYTTFVDTNKEEYRFSDTDDIEIRELFVIACSGFSIRS